MERPIRQRRDHQGKLSPVAKSARRNPRQPRFIETLPKRGYRVSIEPQPLAGAATNEAQELAQKGHASLSEQPTEASLKQARLYFERAVEAEPEDAAALSGLARTYVLMAGLGLGSAAEFLPRAQVAAMRALELDSTLAGPHLALAVVHLLHHHDHAAAERHFRIALERKPEDPVSHIWYARFLASQNRTTEALAEGRRALEADPLSLTARRELLNLLFAARRYDETIAEARRLLDINPAFPDVHLGIVWIYLLQGQEQPAFEAFLAGLKGLGVAAPLLDQARETFRQGGMPAILRQWVELLERNAALGEKNQFDLIVLHSLLGDRDRCFELLEGLRQHEHPLLFWLPVMPVFDNLRADPRYARLLVQLGFPQPFPNQ